MDWLLIILAYASVILGFVGSIVPVLPGPIMAYGGLWLAKWSSMANFSTSFLIIMGIVTAVVIASDYIFPSLITRRFGGTKEASRGALIGSIIGIFLTPVGMVGGMMLGAYLGQLRAEKQSAHPVKAALGSFLGFLVGTGVKMIFCTYALWNLIVSTI